MSSGNAHSLDLIRLIEGIPALSLGAGENMIEACMICFDSCGHKSGVELKVHGTFGGTFVIKWSDTITDDMRRYWRDEDEATEYAAYGIALLLIEPLTGYTAIERANKGFGFDFWLGSRDRTTFQNEARFEISGIRRGSKQQVSARVKEKKIQTDISNGQYPVYIAVIEFGTPMAQVVRK